MKKQLLFVFAMMLAVVGLHAQTACTAPTGLKATAHSPEWRNVYLNWNPVVDPSQQIINWSSTGTGHANSGSDFIAAIRFATSDLTAHNGKALTAVQFRPGMSSSECTYTIKVWMGSTLNTSDNTYTEGTLVCSQVVSQNLELGALNTIPLETPITIDPTQELVIGIQCVHSISGFPMGYCTDAVISYKSGLTYTSASGWHELVLSGTQRGWHICGVLTNTNNIVAGYNVYRDNNLLTTTHNNYYVDTLYSDGTAYYDITASYANGCESSATSDSVVMNNAVVGKGAVLTRCLVMDDVKIPENAVLGSADSEDILLVHHFLQELQVQNCSFQMILSVHFQYFYIYFQEFLKYLHVHF